MAANDEKRPADAPEQNASETVQGAPAEDSPSGEQAATSRMLQNKRGLITAGVIVAVIVVAFAAFWIWHEQPSFCNAVCHNPMDRYVETYYEGDPGMLVTAHAEAGDTCLSCHEAEITTQVSEVMAWVSDNYPMTEDGTMLATGKQFADEEFCLRSGCHDYSEVVASTWGFEGNDADMNPHSSHQDLALECGDCHKAHEKSVLVCAECHSMNLPEGWEAPGDEQ